MVRQIELDAGTTVLVDKIDSTEVVSIGYWFLHGSRDESENERGYSHFLEHMLFKGTKNRTAFQIVQEIDKVGGILNGFTEKETTCFYCTLPCDFTEHALDILSDMVFNSIFTDAEIEKEKHVVINEILSTLDNPEELAYEHFLNGFWKEHALAQNITGKVEHIKNITKEKLIKFYRERYNVFNLIISIAGNINIDKVIKCIERKVFPGNMNKYPLNREKPVKYSSWEYIKGSFTQVQVYTGTEYQIKSDKLRTLYSLIVLNTLLGDSMSSRLFQEIREKKALCYSVSSNNTLYSDVLLWIVYTSTAPENVIKIIKALDDEFIRLKKELPDRKEIEDAQTHLKGNLVLMKSDMETRMKRLVRVYAFLGRIMEYDESIKSIDMVTEQSVVGIINEMIISSKFNLTAFGSRGIKDFNKCRFNF